MFQDDDDTSHEIHLRYVYVCVRKRGEAKAVPGRLPLCHRHKHRHRQRHMRLRTEPEEKRLIFSFPPHRSLSLAHCGVSSGSSREGRSERRLAGIEAVGPRETTSSIMSSSGAREGRAEESER